MIGRVLGAWVHDLDPVAIHFPASWGLRGVHWYGLAYAAGFLAAAWMLGRWRRQGLAPARHAADESTLVTAVMVGVLAGGRLGHVLLYARDEFAADPLMVFQVWKGGMASHGGFLGVVLAGLWYARTRGVPFLAVGDLLCALAPAGILFGRLANFVNGELFGRPSDVAWAMVFPHGGPEPRHPSQLYQAGLEGLALGLILSVLFWKSDARLKPGALAGHFVFWMGGFRFVAETVREPDVGVHGLLGMTMGQTLCVPMVLIGLYLILTAQGRRDRADASDGHTSIA